MAGICQICFLGQVILSSFLTGTTGYTDVFSSSGDDVSLRCDNALSGCTSTTWNYNQNIRLRAVELFYNGKKKNDIKRPERLSLGSDCSLNIYKTTVEDHGLYTCKQYVKKEPYGTETSVSLHVLHVSSTQNEMRSGSSVTLSCQLFSFENSCDTLVRSEGIQLVWVNQAGVNLHTDSRYQILSQGQCISTLTTKLLNEDNNKEWRCLLKMRKETKTTASYTVRFIGSNTLIPVTTINKTTTNASETEGSKICVSLYRVIVVIVQISVFEAPTVIFLQIICAGRASGNRRNAHPEDTVISTTYK